MPKAAPLEIPIDEVPEVADLKARLAEAQAEFVAAEAEVDRLHRILNPLPSSSDHTPNTSEIEFVRSRQQEPFAHERYLMAKAAVLEVRPRFEKAMAAALTSLNAERTRARLPLLRRFADALEAAKLIGDEISTFDAETMRLGGSRVEHPCAWLIDELPHRHGESWRVTRLVEELER